MCRPSLPTTRWSFCRLIRGFISPLRVTTAWDPIDCWRSGKFELGGGNLCYDRRLRCTEGMFLGAAGLVEEVLEFVDFGVKTVVQSKASLIAVVVLKRAIAAKRKDQKV